MIVNSGIDIEEEAIQYEKLASEEVWITKEVYLFFNWCDTRKFHGYTQDLKMSPLIVYSCYCGLYYSPKLLLKLKQQEYESNPMTFKCFIAEKWVK